MVDIFADAVIIDSQPVSSPTLFEDSTTQAANSADLATSDEPYPYYPLAGSEEEYPADNYDDDADPYAVADKSDSSLEDPFATMMKLETFMKWSVINPAVGNLTYLLVSAGVVLYASLSAFRYTKVDHYYDHFWNKQGTEWYRYGDLLQLYTNLSLFGIGLLTQILSMYGIANSIHYTFWMWGVMTIGGLSNIVAIIMKFLAYESALFYSDTDS